MTTDIVEFNVPLDTLYGILAGSDRTSPSGITYAHSMYVIEK